jgi:hypothetical protein
LKTWQNLVERDGKNGSLLDFLAVAAANYKQHHFTKTYSNWKKSTFTLCD